MKKQYALILIAAFVLMVSISAVYARGASDDEENCITKPASAFSLAMVTESAVFLFAGGLGPILIVALVAVIAAIVSHLIWGGF
jgi:hypothetical protein|tara:strand:- start:307 stop:558 length:252 start_codon:yes stop_codon:yes gene_type:complete